MNVMGAEYRVDYEPAESSTGLFGGNSNWRGPIWFPLNFLLVESLQKFHHYLGDDFKVESRTSHSHPALAGWQRWALPSFNNRFNGFGVAKETVTNRDMNQLSALPQNMHESATKTALSSGWKNLSLSTKDDLLDAKGEPAFDGLSSDPRCQDLLRRVGLPQ